MLTVDGGILHGAKSNRPVRLIELDEDIEGGDESNIHEVNGAEVYITEFALTAPAEPGANGIDARSVKKTLKQLPN